MYQIDFHQIDLAFIQETWLAKSDGFYINSIKDYGFNVLHSRNERQNNKGGGVAVIYKENLDVTNIKLKPYNSFDHIYCNLKTSNGILSFINIYRPGYSKKLPFNTSYFCDQFKDLLTESMSERHSCFILGDLNIHQELLRAKKDHMTPDILQKHKDAIEFQNILTDNDFIQLIKEPTHTAHGTLDVLITQRDSVEKINSLQVKEENSFCNTDHFPIVFELNAKVKIKKSKIKLTKRSFKSFDVSNYVEDLQVSLVNHAKFDDADTGVKLYNSTTSECLNRHAPLTTFSVSSHKRNSWWNKDLLELRRKVRRAERSKKISKFEKKRIVNSYKEAITNAKLKDNTEKFDKSKHDPKLLFKTFDNLTKLDKEVILPVHSNSKQLANDFAHYYVDKIDLIMEDIEKKQNNASLQHISLEKNLHLSACNTFSKFDLISTSSLKRTLASIKSKQSSNDPIPTWLLKECPDQLYSVIVRIVNSSLAQGNFPGTLKQAVVIPIIKDKLKDRDDLKNYRPVSTLTSLSKVIEHDIAK